MGNFTNTLTHTGDIFRIVKDLNDNNSSRVKPIHPYSDFPSIFYQEKLQAKPEGEKGNESFSFANENSKDHSTKKTGDNNELPEIFQLILDDQNSKFIQLWGGDGEFEHNLIVKQKRKERGITSLEPKTLDTDKIKSIPESLPLAYLNSDIVFKNYVGSMFTGDL